MNSTSMCPNPKQFHVEKILHNNISTIIGVSSSIFFLVYLAFEPWITRVHDELAG